jgi:transposase
MTFGKPNAFSDLFGMAGRKHLDALEVPEPWLGDLTAALSLVDTVQEQIEGCERELRRLSADHRYIPLLMTAPGIGYVLGYTIASEIGDITRFASLQALRLHRPVSTRLPVGGTRPPRAHLQERT